MSPRTLFFAIFLLSCGYAPAANLCVSSAGTAAGWQALGYAGAQCDAHFDDMAMRGGAGLRRGGVVISLGEARHVGDAAQVDHHATLDG